MGVIDPCEEGYLDKIAVMRVATGEVTELGRVYNIA